MMKGILACLAMVAISLAVRGQDGGLWTMYGFLEGADLQADFYSTDHEIGGGLGLSRSIGDKQGVALEIFVGPNFSDTRSSNTFVRWDLDWQGLDLLYHHRWGNFKAVGGLSYTEIDEERVGRNFGEVTRLHLKHRGPSLVAQLRWHFVSRAGVYLKYRHYVGTVEDSTRPRPVLLADSSDPAYFSVGMFWRFF